LRYIDNLEKQKEQTALMHDYQNGCVLLPQIEKTLRKLLTLKSKKSMRETDLLAVLVSWHIFDGRHKISEFFSGAIQMINMDK